MEEKIGAYVINEKGEIVVDQNDEAMVIRLRLKKKHEKDKDNKKSNIKEE